MAKARYWNEAAMQQQEQRRPKASSSLAAIIAAVRLAREPNVSIQTPHVASVIWESISLALSIAERVGRG
jgi:hypothetical protein